MSESLIFHYGLRCHHDTSANIKFKLYRSPLHGHVHEICKQVMVYFLRIASYVDEMVWSFMILQFCVS